MITAPTGWGDFYAWSSVFQIQIDVTLTNTVTFSLYSNNIEMGTLSIDDQICEPGELKPGSVISQVLNFSIINNIGTLNNVDFRGAKMVVKFFAEDVDPIVRGTFYVDEAKKVGSYIDITAYGIASKYDVADLDGYDMSGKNASTILLDILGYDGVNYFNSSLPNYSYQVGNIVVGASGSPISKDVTRRELAQYICELCGGYIYCKTTDNLNEWAVANGFVAYDYTDTLDGGDFSFEGSPSDPAIVGEVIVGEFIVGTETREDIADGGLFSAPFAVDIFSVPDSVDYYHGDAAPPQTGSYDIYVSCSGGKSCYVSGTSTYSTLVKISFSNTFAPGIGTFLFCVSALPDCLNDVRIVNMRTNEYWIGTESGTVFTCDNPSDKFYAAFTFKSNTTGEGSFECSLYTSALAQFATNQMIWQQSEPHDGGYFGLWGLASQTVYQIPKVMEYPIATERIPITKVVVIGSGFDNVEVGSDEGATVTIDNNPLITSAVMAQTVATNVLSALEGVTYHKFNVVWSADPRLEPGDLVSFTDKNGNTETSITTGFIYRHGQFSNVSCVE